MALPGKMEFANPIAGKSVQGLYKRLQCLFDSAKKRIVTRYGAYSQLAETRELRSMIAKAREEAGCLCTPPSADHVHMSR